MEVPSRPKTFLSSSLADISSSAEFDKKDVTFTSVENILSALSSGVSDRESYSETDSDSVNDEIHKASRKQKLFAKKSIKRDKKREKEQRKKIDKNIISMDDFLSKQSEYKSWLQEERGKCVEKMTSSKLKTHFKTFVKLWNKKKLLLKYYRGSVGNETPTTTNNTQRFSFIDDPVSEAQTLRTNQLTNLAQEDLAMEDSPFSTFGKIPPKMKCKTWPGAVHSSDADLTQTDGSPGASPVFAMIYNKENKKRPRIPPRKVSSPQIHEYQIPQHSQKPLKLLEEYHVPQKVCRMGHSSSSEGEKSPTKRTLNWNLSRTNDGSARDLIRNVEADKCSDSDSISLMSMPADGMSLTNYRMLVKPQVDANSFHAYDGDNSSLSSMSTDKSLSRDNLKQTADNVSLSSMSTDKSLSRDNLKQMADNFSLSSMSTDRSLSRDNLKQTTDDFSLSSVSIDKSSSCQFNDDTESRSSLGNNGEIDLWPSPPSPIPGDNLSYLEYKKRCKNRRSSLPPPPPPLELLRGGTFNEEAIIEEDSTLMTHSPSCSTLLTHSPSCPENRTVEQQFTEVKNVLPQSPAVRYDKPVHVVGRASSKQETDHYLPTTYSVDSTSILTPTKTSTVPVTIEDPTYEEISTMQGAELCVSSKPVLTTDADLKTEEPVYAQVVKSKIPPPVKPKPKHIPPSPIKFLAPPTPEIPPKMYPLEEDHHLDTAGNGNCSTSLFISVNGEKEHNAGDGGEEKSLSKEKDENEAMVLRAKSKEYFNMIQAQNYKSPQKVTSMKQVTSPKERTHSYTARETTPTKKEKLVKKSVTFETDNSRNEIRDTGMKTSVDMKSREQATSSVTNQNGIIKPSLKRGVRKISRTKLNSLSQINKNAGVLETDIDATDAENGKTTAVETDIW